MLLERREKGRAKKKRESFWGARRSAKRSRAELISRASSELYGHHSYAVCALCLPFAKKGNETGARAARNA